MNRELTKLEKGIIVKISGDDIRLLSEHPGFLPRMAYPDLYEDIAVENEIGRFLSFRFIEEK